MDYFDLILWVVALSCASLLFQCLRSPVGPRGLWLFISGGILLYIAVGYGLRWPWVVPVATGLWGTLLILPIVGASITQRLVIQQKYTQAKQIAEGLKFLHPGDGWWDYPHVLSALTLTQSGQGEAALHQISQFRQNYSPMALHAIALTYRLQGQWQGYLNWLDQLPTRIHWQRNPTLVLYYIRALGEIQDFELLFDQLESYLPLFERDQRNLAILKLFCLAFSGQEAALNQFLLSPKAPIVGEAKAFWQATAAMTAGRTDVAIAHFEQLLSQTQDQALRVAIQHRLSHPLPQTLSFMSKSLRRSLDEKVPPFAVSSRYDFGRQGLGLTLLTFVLICANLFVYGLQLSQGGSPNQNVIIQLGGLWPYDVWDGEFWRLLTANFLHVGPTHLAMNMLGLWFLGPFVERALGKFSYLLVYLGSGVGAMLCIAYIPKFFPTAPEFTIGASGSVMGLVGAIACITLWGWLVERVAIAARRFRTVLFMIGLQTAFDFSMKNISVTGHLSGMVIGFFLSLILILILGLKKQSQS